MAVWSKALPMTASCLSPLPGVGYHHVRNMRRENITIDLGLGGGFRQVLRFHPPVTTG